MDEAAGGERGHRLRASLTAYIFMPFMSSPFVGAGLRGADGFDRELDRDRPGVLEGERRRDLRALVERLRQVGEHDVVAAGREPDRAVGGDVEPVLQFAHLS